MEEKVETLIQQQFESHQYRTVRRPADVSPDVLLLTKTGCSEVGPSPSLSVLTRTGISFFFLVCLFFWPLLLY